MSETLADLSAAVILGASLIVASLAIYFVYQTAAEIGLSEKSRALTTSAVAISLAGWFLIALYLSNGGSLATNARGAGFLTVFLPLILGTALLFASKNLRRINQLMPAHWLIAVQFYRIAGAIFLFPFFAYGLLPAGFAIPAGVGDVIVGLTAPLVALMVARKSNGWLTAAIAWNVVGILDLIVAPASAVLSGAQTIGQFPLVMIPLFLGPPLGTLLHIYSLVNLSAAAQKWQQRKNKKNNSGNASVVEIKNYENAFNASVRPL